MYLLKNNVRKSRDVRLARRAAALELLLRHGRAQRLGLEAELGDLRLARRVGSARLVPQAILRVLSKAGNMISSTLR